MARGTDRLFPSTAHQLAGQASELRNLAREIDPLMTGAQVQRLINQRVAALEARLALNAATGRALEATHA